MKRDISVIIPYHNESKSLETTLNLVASQTCQPEEVLFIDSSSTDDSYHIIQEWIKNNGPKYDIAFRNISEGTNVPGSSKNIGIKHAKTNILAFMDCGLLFDLDWLQSQIEYLQANNADVVSGLCYLEGVGLIDRSAIAQTYGFRRLRPTVPSTMLKKSVFEKTGLFLDNRRAGYDVDWVKKLEREKIERKVNKSVVIRYDGINYANSLKAILIKTIKYSEPTIGIYGYRYPYYYIIIGFSIILMIPFINYGDALILLTLYLVLRGYIIPAIKSRNIKLIMENPPALITLPIVGFLIDLGKLLGYVKGAIKFMIAKIKIQIRHADL
jgi:glycosyltransferase involved in cell wall biosynthesis